MIVQRLALIPGILLLCALPSLAQDTYSYDGDGNTIGLSTVVDGLTLSVRATAEGVISAPGMPTLTTSFDSSHRLRSLNGPGGPLVTYTYAGDGSVRTVTLPGDLRLTSTIVHGVLTQQVSAGGVNVQQAQVPGMDDSPYGHGRWHLLLLDLLKRQLHLSDDWFNTVSLKYNADDTVDTVRSQNGMFLFYLLRFGTINVGFDSRGQGLFYDIDRPLEIMGQVETPSGAPPTRIVVTRDQRVQVQAPWTPDGAIESIWYDPAAPKAKTRASRTVAYTVKTITAPSVYAFCASSTVCESGSSGSAGCATVPYYCDYDGCGGPRCYDCDNDPGPTVRAPCQEQ